MAWHLRGTWRKETANGDKWNVSRPKNYYIFTTIREEVRNYVELQLPELRPLTV